VVGSNAAQGFARLDLIFTRWRARAQFVAGGRQDQLLPSIERGVKSEAKPLSRRSDSASTPARSAIRFSVSPERIW
jgi:malate synthase